MSDSGFVVPTKHPVPELVTSSVNLTEMFERVLDQVDISNGTRRTYRYGVRDFTSWNVDGTLDQSTLVRYKNYLRDRTDLTTGTKNLYLSGVRTVVRTLYTLGVLERDTGKGLKGFKITRCHKSGPITDDQVEKTFRVVREMKDKRLFLLFSLLYLQGLRQKECLTLRIEDFEPDTKSLWIVGRETGLKSGYLFWSRKNKSGHMTSQNLNWLIRKVHGEVGITNTGHSWRKVFVSKLIDSGMDLLTVSSFSRHKSIEMLKVYYDRLDREKKLPKYYEVFSNEVSVM